MKRNRERIEEDFQVRLEEAAAVAASQPKQVIMYHANDDDPDRLYMLARLEDETIDKIADRVIAKLDERKGKRK